MSQPGFSPLQALPEISLELSTLPDTDAFCRRAEWALGHLGFDRVGLWFTAPQDPEWSVGTWATDDSGALRDEGRSRVRRDPLLAPEGFSEGTLPVIVNKDEVCYDARHQEVSRADKAVAPLWNGKEIVGELAVDCRFHRRSIGAAELELLVLHARIVAHLYTLLKTREALARMSEQRGALLRELKHRTRDNLSVISGLISLVSARVVSDEDLSTVARHLAQAHGADARQIRIELDLAPVLVEGRQASSLGLGLVRGMARQLGRTFSARSDPGAVFTLTFPV